MPEGAPSPAPLAEASTPVPKSTAPDANPQGKGKWFRSPSEVTAILALLISVITTVSAFTQARAQRIESDRREFREILNRMADLRGRQVQAAFGGQVVAQASDDIGVASLQQRSYSSRAQEILAHLPDRDVTASDYVLLAGLQLNGFEMVNGVRNLERALKKAVQAGDGEMELSALVFLAGIDFSRGNPTDGREKYGRSLARLLEFYAGAENANYRHYREFSLLLSWATNELTLKACPEAITQARAAVSSAQQTILMQNARDQGLLSQLALQIKQICQTDITQAAS